MKEEIDAAVGWWTDQLRGMPRHDSGDPEINFVTAINTSGLRPLEEKVIVAFALALAGRLPEHLKRHHWDEALEKGNPTWGSYGRTLACDYGPGGVLYDAAMEAGVPAADLRFPMKTVMWIDPGSVAVAKGYRAETLVIFAGGVRPLEMKQQQAGG